MGMRSKPDGPQSATAPATVVGEPKAKVPLGNREGGLRRRPESQETCRHRRSSYGPGGVAEEALLNTQVETTPVVSGSERSSALIAAAVALVFGVGLVFTMGLSHPTTIHNAAHDTRHALSFPCH